MYPPPRIAGSGLRSNSSSPSRTVPYPVEDIQQAMGPVALSSPSTPTQKVSGVQHADSPVAARYDQPFTFQGTSSPNATAEPADVLRGREGGPEFDINSYSNRLDLQRLENGSTDTFQSAKEVPPPYEESETQQFLHEKIYRSRSDLSGSTGTVTTNAVQSVSQSSPTLSPPTPSPPTPSPPTPSQPTLDPPRRDLSQHSDEAKRFYHVYQTTVDDSPNFTCEIQMTWCETLLTFAFIPEFINNYNINADKLKRKLTTEETLKNQKIILEHALKVLTKLITLQHAPALYLMATLYSHQPYLNIKIQSIVPRNDSKALDYYSRAAALDHADACFRAGVCYEFQRGTASDLDKSQCLRKAAEFFERGASNCGNTQCMYKLAMFALHGVPDEAKPGHNILPQDLKTALAWFHRAEGSPQALYELAKIYERDGLSPALQDQLRAAGVVRDPARALRYYHTCATRHSYPLAQWRLGHCYEFGQLSLPVVPSKSIAWYAKAAMAKPRGNPMAMMALSGWYLTGAEGLLKPNNQEACAWAQKACQAADGKLARAEYALAFFSENGIGCTPNITKAREHYQIAAQAGHVKAQERLRAGI